MQRELSLSAWAWVLSRESQFESMLVSQSSEFKLPLTIVDSIVQFGNPVSIPNIREVLPPAALSMQIPAVCRSRA
jgi:hypothetical protein